MSSGNDKPRRLPGEDGIWLFVLGDMLMFALFFATFLFYRRFDPAGFDRSQSLLDVHLGVLNTILLLTSSWFVVSAVESLRANRTARARALLSGAILCGAGFVVVKAFEYGAKFAAGINLLTNDFFTYYFMFTGLHLVHVLLGLGVLGLLASRARTAGPREITLFENGATFWHMVDLLWIMLFALLYLVCG